MPDADQICPSTQSIEETLIKYSSEVTACIKWLVKIS